MALHHREAGPSDGPVALLLHGYPESSAMWRHLLPVLGDAGWRALAPDFPGFGRSEPDPPNTWERLAEAVESFRTEQGIERCVPIVHDWGGLIGLRWACDHPDAVAGLVISGTGFFHDGRWNGMAKGLRTPGTGEELVDGLTREAFGGLLQKLSPAMDDAAIDDYWLAYTTPERRAAQLEMYRSLDFEMLAPYEPRLAALDVPALLLWGEGDDFAPVGGAKRFDRDLPDTELVVVEGAGHFVFEDAPERCAEAVTAFLAERIPR